MSTDGNRRRFQGFTFYPDKWEADTSQLSDRAYRAYHQLLCFMWRKGADQCSVRNTDEALSVAIFRKNFAKKSQIRKVMTELMNPDCQLLKVEGERLVSVGLRKEYEKALEMSEKGAKAAEKRYASAGLAMPPVTDDGQAFGNAPIPIPSKEERDLNPKSKIQVKANSKPARGGEVLTVGAVLGEMTDRQSNIQELVLGYRRWLKKPGWHDWLVVVFTKLLECGGSAASLELEDLLFEADNATDPLKAKRKDVQVMTRPERLLPKRITELCKRYGAKPWPDFPA